jgi:cytochrome c oxidase assembly factor CtaG
VTRSRFAWLAGLALVVITAATGIAVAHRSLTIHMLRHLALLHIAPLLMIIGGSGGAAPPRRRSWHARSVRRHASVGWLAGAAGVAVWSAPPIVMWAMAGSIRSAFADAGLVVAGVLFWMPIVSVRAGWRLETGGAIAYLFTACLTSTLTGAAIAFAPAGLYGLDDVSAADQQIAGLLMWVPCCALYVVVIMADRWHAPKPERIPRPTYCPVMLAAGVMLMMASPVTSWILTAAGAALTIVALACWINELRHESQTT